MKGERENAGKMKKYLGKLLSFFVVLVMVVSVWGNIAVSADEEYTWWDFYHTTTDKVKTFTGENGNSIIANCYYERLVLVGLQKGIKKINKTLKKCVKKLDYKSLYAIAEEDVKDGRGNEIYNDNFKQEVHSYGTDYVSIIENRYWWAGGVSNSFTQGYTFDLNTGKLLKPGKITGLSYKEIKEKYKKALKADPDFRGMDFDIDKYVDGIKEADFNYYINGDEFVAVMAPYTFYGGWSRTYVLDGVSIIYK